MNKHIQSQSCRRNGAGEQSTNRSVVAAGRRAALLLSAALSLSAALGLFASATALADPCGMVPPIYIDGDVPLERIGLQKTFVFYKDGVETFVIRPGFQGSVDEFGMLIPFPSPPALRKVADDTFAHIAAAVDPPEIIIDLTPVPWDDMVVSDMAMPTAEMSGAEEDGLAINQVNILKQEAVGMYEVAVLEAGSAAALNTWMTDHGYRYPEGMDDVCNDYVDEKWCFVAVKARVGQKDGVDPRPGMKNADSNLPNGATFDGHVQGMGFRFKSEELVVPMRLSAFNEGDLHNVVYLLTDGPMKARDLPAGHVVRQVTGVELLRNVTEPLPLRIIGGTYNDIPEDRRQSLVRERDPAPHNGIARDLFAGDLLAASSGKLSHDHEELEKELLDIGERLNLRGAEIDSLHENMLKSEREELTASAIRDIEGMTMTVIDGDFERKVIAEENVYFSKFEMNPTRNTPQRYNARIFGPSSEGLAVADASNSSGPPVSAVAVTDPDHGRLILQDSDGAANTRTWLILAGVLITAAFLCVVFIRRSRGTTAGLLLFSLLVADGIAQDADTAVGTAQLVEGVLDEIDETSDRSAAISSIRSVGEDAVPVLLDTVRNGQQIQRRGWAVVCLREIGGPQVANGLDGIVSDGQLPPLVRTWAAAARIDDASHFEDLERFVKLCGQFPALRRPLRLKVLAMTADSQNEVSVEKLLRMAAADFQLQQALAPVLLKTKPDALATVLMTSADTNTRNQAASWLATMKTRNVSGVNAAVAAALKFRKDAEAPPWGDGPLFIPGMNWSKPEAIAMINELTAWYVWCEANQQPEQISKITTNLNSWQLMQAAGYKNAFGSASQWLVEWERVIGTEAAQELMQRTGFRYSPATFEKIE